MEGKTLNQLMDEIGAVTVRDLAEAFDDRFGRPARVIHGVLTREELASTILDDYLLSGRIDPEALAAYRPLRAVRELAVSIPGKPIRTISEPAELLEELGAVPDDLWPDGPPLPGLDADRVIEAAGPMSEALAMRIASDAADNLVASAAYRDLVAAQLEAEVESARADFPNLFWGDGPSPRRLAVGVGRSFNLFEERELAGIDLEESGTALEVAGKRYMLMKGSTYEDSRKVDGLLDEKGEFKISDYIAGTALDRLEAGARGMDAGRTVPAKGGNAR